RPLVATRFAPDDRSQGRVRNDGADRSHGENQLPAILPSLPSPCRNDRNRSRGYRRAVVRLRSGNGSHSYEQTSPAQAAEESDSRLSGTEVERCRSTDPASARFRTPGSYRDTFGCSVGTREQSAHKGSSSAPAP